MFSARRQASHNILPVAGKMAVLKEKQNRRLRAPVETGSFVPFTIVTGCSTDKAMEENSAQALDGELFEVSEISFDWPQSLPVERIKAGLTEIALGLTMFAALVAFCCSR